MDFILPEQTSLLGAGPGDPFFGGRLDDQDAVAELGAAFVLNAQTSPAQVSTTGLIPGELVANLGDWLRGLLLREDDGLAVLDPTPESPLMRAEDLGAHTGIALETLPPAYADWRFSIEVYVLHGRALYSVPGELALRTKVLSDDELGIAYGPRLRPLDEAEPGDALAFLVAVLPRTAALGGLRGQRRAFLAAGEAKGALASAATRPWRWDTEFYDDAACRVLGVDGVERVPLVIGVQEVC